MLTSNVDPPPMTPEFQASSPLVASEVELCPLHCHVQSTMSPSSIAMLCGEKKSSPAVTLCVVPPANATFNEPRKQSEEQSSVGNSKVRPHLSMSVDWMLTV